MRDQVYEMSIRVTPKSKGVQAAGCCRSHGSRFGLRAPLRSRSSGCSYNHNLSWSPAVSSVACGATLKRPLELEVALLSLGALKRRRCARPCGPTRDLRPPAPPAAAAPDADPTAGTAAACPARLRAAPSNSGANVSEHKPRI